MAKKILIAPNSYKESASSVVAAGLFSKYLSGISDLTISAPLSDGGDGFLEVCKRNFSLEEIIFSVHSPLGNKITVPVGYNKENKNIYIESADLLGIKLIPSGKRNPMKYSSRGLGELIIKICSRLSVDKIIVGIGGTSTNDLGLGMMSALGLKLYSNKNDLINPVPDNYGDIKDIKWEPETNIPFEIIADVDNPLLGENGSSYVYGPQKGLKEDDVQFLDNQFKRLTGLFKEKKLVDNNIKLNGAGGGLAAGMQIFLKAKIKSAEEFILKDLGLKKLLKDSDIVITGEGSFDKQSLTGKASGVLIRIFNKQIFLVCGKTDRNIYLPPNVIPIELNKFFSSIEESILNFEDGIQKASSVIMHHIRNNPQ